MIYTCDKCHFTFERAGDVDACPDCGKVAIREADEDEKTDYKRNLVNRDWHIDRNDED